MARMRSWIRRRSGRLPISPVSAPSGDVQARTAMASCASAQDALSISSPPISKPARPNSNVAPHRAAPTPEPTAACPQPTGAPFKAPRSPPCGRDISPSGSRPARAGLEAQPVSPVPAQAGSRSHAIARRCSGPQIRPQRHSLAITHSPPIYDAHERGTRRPAERSRVTRGACDIGQPGPKSQGAVLRASKGRVEGSSGGPR